MKVKTESIVIPRTIIHIDLVGTNSLIGGLCQRFIEGDLIKDVGLIHPVEIVFVIKKIQIGVNLYDELNKVRDLFKIDEKKITLYVH